MRCQTRSVQINDYLVNKTKNTRNIIKTIFSFFVSQRHALIFGHCCLIFHVNCLHIPLYLFNHRFQFQYADKFKCVNQFKVFSPIITDGPCICVIRPRDLVLELETAAFGSYNCLAVFIHLSLFMLARLILFLRWIGSQSEPHQGRCVLPERNREILTGFVNQG